MSAKRQALMLVLFALLGGGLRLPASQGLEVRLLGAGLTLLGLAVVFAALVNYMQVNCALVNVSPEPDASARLVEIGLYRYIRHPIYTGVMMCGLGAALAHGHWINGVIALVLCAFFTYKSFFEERWLAQVYPTYHDYQWRTGRFLPLLIGSGQ